MREGGRIDEWTDNTWILRNNENDVHSFGKTDRSVTNEKRRIRTSYVNKHSKSQPYLPRKRLRKENKKQKKGETPSRPTLPGIFPAPRINTAHTFHKHTK